MPKPPVSSVSIVRHGHDESEERDDLVVAEEPLEIRVGYGSKEDREQMSLSVTMRTPGMTLNWWPVFFSPRESSTTWGNCSFSNIVKA